MTQSKFVPLSSDEENTELIARLLLQQSLAEQHPEPYEGAPNYTEQETLTGRTFQLDEFFLLQPTQRLERYIDSFGFENFSGSEFTPYWSYTCGSTRNSVPPEHLWPEVIRPLALLQKLRTHFGASVYITSTYRSPSYNACIGGASASRHMSFNAIDFQCRRGTPRQWRDFLDNERGVQDDPLNPGETYQFKGGLGLYRSFVHIDTRPWVANW